MDADYSRGIKDMPLRERPTERFIECGPEAVSTAELIAIIIRCGRRGENAVDIGLRVLGACGTLRRLSTIGVMELAGIKGIGLVKAAQIKSAIELGRRVFRRDGETRPGISSPGDAVGLLMPAMRDLEREEFRVIFLDTRNRVIDTSTISTGSLNSSIVHPREVFKEAIRASSAAIIVAHNHPSGDPSPSSDDVAITQRLVRAGALMGIEVLDHIIVGDNAFVSLRDKGLLHST